MTHNHEAENTATILAISEPSAAEWRERAEKAERERDEARQINGNLAQMTNRQIAELQNERDDARKDCEVAETMYAEERQRTKHARALIARAVEAIEPFNALIPSDADRPDNAVVQIPAYLSKLRRLAALAENLRKAVTKA